MYKSPSENVTYEFALTSLAEPRMSGSFYLNGFGDERQVAIQLLFVGCCTQNFFKIAYSILVSFPSSFISLYFAIVYAIYPYICIYIYIYIYIYSTDIIRFEYFLALSSCHEPVNLSIY